MPIGTSSGEYFDDQYDYTVRRPVINPDVDPRFMTNDQNVIHPNQLETGKEVDKMEVDPQTGTGIPIGLKKVYITGQPAIEDRQEDTSFEGPASSRFEQNFGISPQEFFFSYPPARYSSNPMAQALGYNDIKKPDAIDTLEFINKVEDFNNPWKGGVAPTSADLPIRTMNEPYTPASRMPFKSPTEPAGALELEEGSQVASEVDWTKMNQPFGSIKGTAPEDTPVVFKGRNITIREGDIDQAINVGMGAGPGIMMGVKARIFSKPALQKAQQLEAEGIHPDEIWSQTGVFKGPDGRWRQEIDDSKAIAKPLKDLTGKSLEDVIDHPDLFKAYPDLKNIEVVPFKEGQFGRAAYNSSNDTIELGKNFKIEDVLHEVQHAIQKREGFATGGSPAEQFALRFEEEVRIAKIEANQLLEYRNSDAFKGWTKQDEGRIQELKRLFEVEALRKGLAFKEAESQYMRLAGEVEARNVETRGILNENARRAIPPIWTEDTPRNLQHVIDRPMWTTPYGPTLRPDIPPNY